MRNKTGRSSYTVGKEIIISCSLSLGLSLLGILAGIKISISWTFIFVIMVSLIFNQLDTKLTCLAYVMAFIYVLDEILVLSKLKAGYFNLPYIEMIYLVGVLHAIEGILTFAYGGKQNLAVMTYRGKKVAGGYHSYGRWFIPLLLFSIQGIYIPIIAVIVYANDSFVLTPKDKAKRMGIWILAYGLVIMLLGYVTQKGILPLILSMITMPILHEMIFSIDNYIEQGRLLYPYPKQGIRVMEFREHYNKDQRIKERIEKGDIILKVNQTRVNSEEAYFDALEQGIVKLVLQKVGGSILEVEYSYETLKKMQLVFLPPI